MSTTKHIDPLFNQKVEEYFDESTGILHVRKTEDVEPLLDELARDRSNGGKGWSTGRTFRKMGSIPNVFVDKIFREEGINLMHDTPEARKRIRRFFAENPAFTTNW